MRSTRSDRLPTSIWAEPVGQVCSTQTPQSEVVEIYLCRKHRLRLITYGFRAREASRLAGHAATHWTHCQKAGAPAVLLGYGYRAQVDQIAGARGAARAGAGLEQACACPWSIRGGLGVVRLGMRA